MHPLLTVLIICFGTASYIIAVRAIIAGEYRPSIFSRAVWLLLSIVSFAGVVASGSSASSILLAGIFLLGCAAICAVSLWKGTHKIGKFEVACMALILLSILIWAIFRTPLISLIVSLFAHFVGALPTYRQVLRDPRDEHTGFWLLFFLASLLSLIASWGSPLTTILFPLYFTLFEGSMTLLASRKSKQLSP